MHTSTYLAILQHKKIYTRCWGWLNNCNVNIHIGCLLYTGRNLWTCQVIHLILKTACFFSLNENNLATKAQGMHMPKFPPPRAFQRSVHEGSVHIGEVCTLGRCARRTVMSQHFLTTMLVLPPRKAPPSGFPASVEPSHTWIQNFRDSYLLKYSLSILPDTIWRVLISCHHNCLQDCP